MTQSAPERVDIAIAGAGIAGLATALAVLETPGPRPRVLVRDPALAALPSRTLRAVTITPASRRLLDRLGVWSAIAAAAQPLTRMRLGDTVPGAIPPPTFLQFDSSDPGEPLAHMVLQDDLRAALLAACRARGVLLEPGSIDDYGLAGGRVTLADPSCSARLLVAADGGRSRLRDRAGIRMAGWDYGQSAIVATIAHSRDHGGEAIQQFLPGGPLAFLPLRAPDGSGRRSSIAWTERTPEALRLAALPAAAFCEALAARGGHDRGTLVLEDKPRAQPLAMRLARRLTAGRLVLAGDAARLIHPLAGQGLNLGLMDADALGRLVGEAMALGLDPGSTRLLEAYARDRRPDQVAMAAATDGLNRLFSNDNPGLRLVRDLGLALVDRAPGLKGRLARRAAGLD